MSFIALVVDCADASGAAQAMARAARTAEKIPVFMIDLLRLVAQQLGKAAVLRRQAGVELRRFLEFGASLGQVTKPVIGERGINADSAVAGIDFLGGAIGVERALEVASGEIEVAAVVQR